MYIHLVKDRDIMKKEIILIASLVIAVVLIFGCTNQNQDQGTKNETKLETTQGIDILKNQIITPELSPGSIGTLSLTVRDNLGGVTAKDIIVGLDNLGLFKVISCGKKMDPTDKRPKNCNGVFGYDPYLVVSKHGVPKMTPGQEINFGWRISAPSQQELGYIALKHPLYYYLEYTYYTATSQSVAFMSQQELVRRQQSGENTQVAGKMKLSAGEITVDLYTQQPIVYYYTYPDNPDEKEPPYDFTLVFKVKNVGDGFPTSDILIITVIPNGISVTKNTIGPLGQEWYKLDDPKCVVSNVLYYNGNSIKTGELSCSDWIIYVFGNDVYKSLPKDRTYVYVLPYTAISSKGRIVPMDLQITSDTLTEMKQTNTPMKFFTFQSYVVYRYYKEGETYINVYPLRT